MKNHPDLPKSAPQWLRDADIEYPKVEIINNDTVLWHNGVWKDGEWNGGIWYGGTWINGMWNNGLFCGGVWFNGIWHGGIWRGGTWRGGDELGPRAYWFFMQTNDGNLKIGCKQKAIQEWKEWFEKSDEQLTFHRNSEEFQLIKEAFYKFYAKTLNT